MWGAPLGSAPRTSALGRVSSKSFAVSIAVSTELCGPQEVIPLEGGLGDPSAHFLLASEVWVIMLTAA